MAIAAEFPDIDTVWSFRGPIAGFEHHRGITHTFLGIPFEAAILVAVFYAFDRWRPGQTTATHASENQKTGVKSRWFALYGLVVLALLSHILLDYTNNYGVRPFFPFDKHWYAASLVFIFDPLLFVLLIAGLTLPYLFALIINEVAGRRQAHVGSGWAVATLLLILCLWSGRAYEHQKAVSLAQQQAIRAPAPGVLSEADEVVKDHSSVGRVSEAPEVPRPLLMAQRSLANPDPFSPFRWYAVTDFGPVYQLATIDTRVGSVDPDRLLNKPDENPSVAAARRSRLGRIYLDWSPMPWIQATSSALATGQRSTDAAHSEVHFYDPRYMGSLSFLRRQGGGDPPLSGVVLLDSRDQVIAEGMDGKFGR